MKLIRAFKGIECPRCKSGELTPDGKSLNIRAYKVVDKRGRDWSQCLVCAKGDPKKGWFVS